MTADADDRRNARRLARCQARLTQQACELANEIPALEIGGAFVATGLGLLSVAYGRQFATKWFRDLLAELEASGDGDFPTTHGHA